MNGLLKIFIDEYLNYILCISEIYVCGAFGRKFVYITVHMWNVICICLGNKVEF